MPQGRRKASRGDRQATESRLVVPFQGELAMRPRNSGTLDNKRAPSSEPRSPILRSNRRGVIDYRVAFGVVVFLWLSSIAGNISPMKVMRQGLDSASRAMAEMAKSDRPRYTHDPVYTPKPIYHQTPIYNQGPVYNNNRSQQRSHFGGHQSNPQDRRRRR